MWCAMSAPGFIAVFFSRVQNINSYQRVTLFTVLITCPTMRTAMLFFPIKTLPQITPPILCVMRDFRRPPRSR